jgi:hypothetical protein
MEVKPPEHALEKLARSDQARKYLDEYGLVILTNLRQYQILERGADGRAVERESFTLAETAEQFWQAVAAECSAAMAMVAFGSGTGASFRGYRTAGGRGLRKNGWKASRLGSGEEMGSFGNSGIWVRWG